MKRSIEYIESIVNAVRGTTSELLNSRCRKRNLVESRQLVFLFAARYGNTWQGVAEKYKRDHATALLGSRHMEDLITTEKKLKTEYDIIKFVLDDEELYLMYLKKKAASNLKAVFRGKMSVAKLEKIAV